MTARKAGPVTPYVLNSSRYRVDLFVGRYKKARDRQPTGLRLIKLLRDDYQLLPMGAFEASMRWQQRFQCHDSERHAQ
jgi:hypothetical protein